VAVFNRRKQKIGDKILIRGNYWRTGINYRGNVSE
jgi:hypothetical protein